MLNDYPELTKALTGSVWFITESSLQMIVEIVNMRLDGRAFSDEEIRHRLEAKQGESKSENTRVEIGGGVGLTSIHGPIFPKANLFTQLSGATSLETFSNDLRELADNEQVKQIVIDFDTPGGVSDMVEETGQLIKEISADKPIFGLANTEAGSAGLWLLSQTTEAYATPSGRVGSLGAFTVHEDVSKLDEKLGRKITYISAGKYKTAGNPHEPLSTDAKEVIQEDINELYSDFRAKVAEGRGKSIEEVEQNFGQGRMLSARKAAEVGMIDGVVSMRDFLDGLVTQNMTDGATSVSGRLSQSVTRMKLLQGGQLLSSSAAEHTGLDSVPETDAGLDSPADRVRITGRKDDKVAEENEDTQELDVQLRELLDLGEDGDVLVAVQELKEEVGPLREVASKFSQKQKFAEMFPDEAAELQRSRKERVETEATRFSEKYAGTRIKDKDGELTTKGFSALLLDRVKDAHMKLAQGVGGVSELEGILEALSNNGIVDYGEAGSSQHTENIDVPEGKTPRIQFSNLVSNIMEADGVDMEAAIKLATKRNPELAEQYASPVSRS